MTTISRSTSLMYRCLLMAGPVVLVSGLVRADMQSLGDAALSRVRGQSGITLEMDLKMSADALSYYDDGQGVHIKGLRVGLSEIPGNGAFHKATVDVGPAGSLNLAYLVEDRRIEFSDIRLAGAPGVSMGGIFHDHTLDGYFNLRSGGALGGAGYTFDTAYTMTGGRLGYRTNGNTVFLDDITLNFEALGVTLDLVGSTLQLAAPSIKGDWRVGAIRFSDDPAYHGKRLGSTGAFLPSYGSLSGSYDLTSTTGITAGGRQGQGLRIDNETFINAAALVYEDDGVALALREISGRYQIQDLRLDVTTDWQNRPAVGLSLGKFDGDLTIGSVEMGAGGNRFGSVNLRFVFEDRTFNGKAYTNAFYLQGGGHPDAGPQGLRVAARWSLSGLDLGYTEDGNQVYVSGLQSWGQGDVTVNVTRDEIKNGTQFYDGLRVGFDGLKAGYRINGLRVGGRGCASSGRYRTTSCAWSISCLRI